jgi:hypothetical protein
MKGFKQINRALSFIPLEAAPDGGKNCLLPCSGRRRPATQEQAPILIFWYFLNFL